MYQLFLSYLRRTCDLNQSELRMYRISHQTPAIPSVISSGQTQTKIEHYGKFKQDKLDTTFDVVFYTLKGQGRKTRLSSKRKKKKKKLTYADLVNEIRDRETLIG